MDRDERRDTGFTLTELLVVVGIVAILAAILFPVFAQARKAARQAVTVSNMRQVMTGFLMYMGDHDDVFPTVRYLGSGFEWSWTQTIYPYTRSIDVCWSGTQPKPPSIYGEATLVGVVKPGFESMGWWGSWTTYATMGTFNKTAGTNGKGRRASQLEDVSTRALVAATWNKAGLPGIGWSRISEAAFQACIPPSGDRGPDGGVLNFAVATAAREHRDRIVTGWVDGHVSQVEGMLLWNCDATGPGWRAFVAREDVRHYWGEDLPPID